jgi:uncharacterized protein YecE (DUF72 family)
MAQGRAEAGPMTIGTAGWSIPKRAAEGFPDEGSHLERYARQFGGVEINSSFYRPHRPATYARWAGCVPEHFRFAMKVPQTITHERRLVEADDALGRFLDEVQGLGSKLGPLLIQLPPKLAFERAVAGAFLSSLRAQFDGAVVLEPRHASWFEAEPEALLRHHRIARVAADPVRAPGADAPGGSPELAYFRLHGSPRVYWSAYPAPFLAGLASRIRALAAAGTPVWCIFDNTGSGAAIADALATQRLIGS